MGKPARPKPQCLSDRLSSAINFFVNQKGYFSGLNKGPKGLEFVNSAAYTKEVLSQLRLSCSKGYEFLSSAAHMREIMVHQKAWHRPVFLIHSASYPVADNEVKPIGWTQIRSKTKKYLAARALRCHGYFFFRHGDQR